MNRSASLKLLGVVLYLLSAHGFRYCFSKEEVTVVDGVKLFHVSLAKTVHCLDFNSNAILHCKPKHSLIIHAAQWSNANCEYKTKHPVPGAGDSVEYHTFDRTDALQQLCDGLTYCFLRPSKVRGTTPSTFLGDPIFYHTLSASHAPATYSLTVSASCINLELSVKGRKVTDTIVSKENDVDFGCNDDELIHLSVTRVDGYAEDGPNRTLKEYNFGPHIFDCNLKQKCKVPKEKLQLCESQPQNPMVFGTGVLVYYCRKPMTFAFCDHVKQKEGTPEKLLDKFVLYAEQDSQVTVKAPLFNLLVTESAVWSTPEKLTDQNVKKNRLELVRFLCDHRNFCAFTPKRSSAGALDTSFEEVHFGGIVKSDEPLVLLAKFGTRHALSVSAGTEGIKSVTVDLKSNLTLKCEQNQEGTLHVLSAVAGVKGTTDKADSVESARFKDLTKVLYKICYRKRECHWNLNPEAAPRPPATSPTGQNGAAGAAAALQVSSLLQVGSSSQPAQPAHVVPAGLENQEITVKYMCKKYTHDPSLVDLLSQRGFSGLELAEGAGVVTDSLVAKEQAENVLLNIGAKLFINLEVFGECTVMIGEFFTIKVGAPNAQTLEAYFTNNAGEKFSHNLERQSTKYVFYVGLLNNTVAEFAMDASDGANNEHYKTSITPGGNFVLPLSLKDVVKGTGGIVGMRVYLTKT